MNLDVIDNPENCDDCGACCFRTSTIPWEPDEFPKGMREKVEAYYASERGKWMVKLGGPCPAYNLLENRCNVQCSKPSVCVGVVVGGKDCLAMRRVMRGTPHV